MEVRVAFLRLETGRGGGGEIVAGGHQLNASSISTLKPQFSSPDPTSITGGPRRRILIGTNDTTTSSLSEGDVRMYWFSVTVSAPLPFDVASAVTSYASPVLF